MSHERFSHKPPYRASLFCPECALALTQQAAQDIRTVAQADAIIVARTSAVAASIIDAVVCLFNPREEQIATSPAANNASSSFACVPTRSFVMQGWLPRESSPDWLFAGIDEPKLSPNVALNGIKPTGASADTAKQDKLKVTGVAASEAMAETDRARVMEFKKTFEMVACDTGLPPALLAAIASRESRGGNILTSDGWGDVSGHQCH
jgi:hypothetical protein